MNQSSAAPIRKVVAGGASGLTIGPFLAVLLLYFAARLNGGPLPDEVQVALTAVVMWLATIGAAYLTPSAKEEMPPAPPPSGGIP